MSTISCYQSPIERERALLQRTVNREGQNQDDTLSIMSESYSPFPSHLILSEHNNKKQEESQALSTRKAKFGTVEALAADKAYEAIDTLTYFPGLKAMNL